MILSHSKWSAYERKERKNVSNRNNDWFDPFVSYCYLPIHKGTYYKDETRVRHYTRLFDEVWNSDVITKANPSNNTTHVELAEIIR